MRQFARVDANQKEIMKALRSAGASVLHVHRVGRGEGSSDLIVGFRGRNYLIEVKTPTGAVREGQRDFASSWRGQYAIVRTVEEAMAIILERSSET